MAQVIEIFQKVYKPRTRIESAELIQNQIPPLAPSYERSNSLAVLNMC